MKNFLLLSSPQNGLWTSEEGACSVPGAGGRSGLVVSIYRSMGVPPMFLSKHMGETPMLRGLCPADLRQGAADEGLGERDLVTVLFQRLGALERRLRDLGGEFGGEGF